MLTIILYDERVGPEVFGIISTMLDPHDARSAKVQLNEGYAHGGGWSHQDGFKMLEDGILKYPGDPPLEPIGEIWLRTERIVLYPYEYVAVVQLDGSFEVCRMD